MARSMRSVESSRECSVEKVPRRILARRCLAGLLGRTGFEGGSQKESLRSGFGEGAQNPCGDYEPLRAP